MRDATRTTRAILRRASSIILLFLLCACDGTLYHSFSTLAGEWQRDSVAEFVYGSPYLPSAGCAVRVEARTDATYRYRSLVVCAGYYNMNDSLLACDTIPIVVYGDDGRRLGATAGILYQQQSDILFPEVSFRDSVTIRLRHIMPDDTLKGVHDIGIRLMKRN